VPSKIGGTGKRMGEKRQRMRQIGRPRECVLCNHDKGKHAMHKLLDVHGKEGRQLVWRGHDVGMDRLPLFSSLYFCSSLNTSVKSIVGSILSLSSSLSLSLLPSSFKAAIARAAILDLDFCFVGCNPIGVLLISLAPLASLTPSSAFDDWTGSGCTILYYIEYSRCPIS